jgi:multidrug efflux pump subunit AcrA (membrane-fusion protein)
MKRLVRWIWIPIVIVVVVLGVLGYSYNQQRQYLATLKALQTQTLVAGPMTASISATGTLAARQAANLSFGVSGDVAQVNVKVGDQVKKGQVLATLDLTSVPSTVNLAEQDLVSAQQALQDAESSQTSEANAEVALAKAQTAYNTALTNYTEEVADPHRGALDAAISYLQLMKSRWEYLASHNTGGSSAKKGPSTPHGGRGFGNFAQREIQAAYAQFMQALQQVESLQYLFDTTGYSGLAPVTGTTTQAMVTAQYEQAKAQLADAQAALKNYQNGGVDPQAVAAAQGQVAADESTIQEAEIIAPFSGTVTAVYILPGDVAKPGTAAISLADRSQLQVDIPISELDINTIAVGQRATLNFDAFPSKNYAGQVTAVSMDPTISSGSVTYAVRVTVGDADPSLLPGMTVGVTIVTANLTNVLVVPTKAVQTVNARKVVYELRNSQLIPVPVTLGGTNATQTEITGGFLQAGQTIVVDPPATIPTRPTGIFGTFGGGGAGFRGGGFGGGGAGFRGGGFGGGGL